MSGAVPEGLARLQRRFQSFLLTSDGEVGEHIASAGDGQAEVRLDVYYQAYRLRLAEALQADFGTVFSYLGEARFEALAFDYVATHPSTQPSIRWCGRNLPVFIREHPSWNAIPALAEVAALDWAISLSFDAEDADIVAVEAMAEVPPEAWAGLRFEFQPSLRTVDLEWNAAEMRACSDAETAMPEPARGDYPVRFAVWRQDMEAMYRSLDVDEAFSLTAAMQGTPFGDLCEGLCEWIAPEHAAMHAAGMLKRWLNDQMISAIRLPAGIT